MAGRSYNARFISLFFSNGVCQAALTVAIFAYFAYLQYILASVYTCSPIKVFLIGGRAVFASGHRRLSTTGESTSERCFIDPCTAPAFSQGVNSSLPVYLFVFAHTVHTPTNVLVFFSNRSLPYLLHVCLDFFFFLPNFLFLFPFIVSRLLFSLLCVRVSGLVALFGTRQPASFRAF